MKDKKKLLLIGGIILVLVLGIVLYLVFFGTNKNNSSDNESTGDKIVAPANNTEELVKEMEAIEIETVTEDEIVFSDEIELKENEKVAVWIYSEPKFLGYFEVLVENGVKKIIGLKEAIEKITIEEGEHNIAITTESGKPLGYVDVRIENNGTLTESIADEKIEEDTEKEEEKEETTEKQEEKTTTKKITETETIKYSSTKQNEVNMKKGTTSVVQAGSNGTKEITYEITYDSNGKELSRKKLSEKTTKEPVNEVVKVGTSDFNINSDKITGNLMGFMCTEVDSLTNPDGAKACDDSKSLKSFNATLINDVAYLYMVNNANITPIKISEYSGMTYSGTYQGALHYFDTRGGDGAQEPLTMDYCNRYGLSCGAW